MNINYNNRKFASLLFLAPLIIISIAVLTISSNGERFLNLNKEINTLLAIAIIFSFVLITHFITDNKIKIYFSYVDLIYLVWLSYNTISYLIFSVNNVSKISVYLFSFVFYILVKYCICRTSNESFLNGIRLGLSIVCSMESVIMILQYLGYLNSNDNLFSVTGTFKNPAPAALFLVTCFPLFVNPLILNTKSTSLSKIMNYIAFILIIVVLPFTKNRTSWTGILIYLLYVINIRFSIFSKFKIKYGRLTLNTSLILFSFILIILFYKFNASSIAGRFLIWKISIQHYLSTPIFGDGFGSFSGNYNKWQAKYFLDTPTKLNSTIFGLQSKNLAAWVRMAYNEYLEILAETGIIGLLIFANLIYFSVRSVRKTNNKAIIDSMSILLVVLISALFSYPFYTIPTLLIFNLSLAMISANSDDKYIIVRLNNKLSNLIYCFLFILSMSASYYMFRVKNAYKSYILAYNLNKANEYKKAFYKYEDASILQFYPNFLLDYGINLLNNGSNSEAIKILQEAKETDNDVRIYMILGNLLKRSNPYIAEDNLIMGTMVTPILVFPKFQLFKFYLDNNDSINYKSIGSEIINTNEKVPNRQFKIVIDSTNYYLSHLK